MDKYKYFTLVLYPDEDTKHREILNSIITTYSYRAIVHNKDEAKVHTHIVFSTPSPRTLASLKKEFNIDYIEFVRTPKKMLEYLTHENDKEKHHYSYDETFGDLEVLSDTDKESSNILTILNFINNFEGYLSLLTLNKFVVDNNLWSYYRRSSYIFIKTLEEKNNLCYINNGKEFTNEITSKKNR